MRKGIVLAGGAGTRLYPLTQATSKQLLPVYDKPMVYYPLSVLMLAGVRDILIITTPDDLPAFKRLLGDGARWGVSLSYVAQPSPDGLAQAFILGEAFLAGEPSVLILGDNIFHGEGLTDLLVDASARTEGATIVGYPVSDPRRYGVVALDAMGKPWHIEEKPRAPKSNYAITGLYFYDGRASEFAKTIKPSERGELEITDLHRRYLEDRSLNVELLGRGHAWLDAGTFETLLQAGEYVRTLEERQGLKIGCLEEVAFRNGWIDADALIAMADELPNNPYCQYLRRVAEDGAARAHRRFATV